MQYQVPLVPQTSNMSCWAASIAMILGWKNQASYADRLLAQVNGPGGSNYMTSYQNGLNPNDKFILRYYGFEIEPPMCYMPGRIKNMLSHWGPLWVATWAPGPHIRVVTGMSGDTLSINDPAPVNRGARYKRSFSQFFGAMENLGSREMGQSSPVYVAYLQA